MIAARAAFTLYFLLTAAYCLLAYVPFTYLQFLRHDLVPWIAWFSRAHAWLWWIASALAGATVLDGLAERRTRALTAGFLAASALGGFLLAVRPLLPRLGNDPASAAWSALSLVPIAWVAAIDLVGSAGSIAWGRLLGPTEDEKGAGEERRLFVAAVGAAM